MNKPASMEWKRISEEHASKSGMQNLQKSSFQMA
jgi:hypothetical protein